MQNLGRAFSFMFEDKDWIQKILIGAAFVLLSCIVVGIPFLLGYLLEVARRSAEGKELPLPDWDNLGEKFGKGLMFFIVLIIYCIPVCIASLILSLIPCIGILLGMIPGLAFAFILPYLAVSYARSGNLNDAFDFARMMDFVKANTSNLAIALVMAIVLNVVASFGVLGLFIGLLFTSFWANLGIYYLYGQVFLEAEKGGAVDAEATVTGSEPLPDKKDEEGPASE